MQRLPKLDPRTLAGRKREVYNTIAGGPRGGVRGPFVALLQCPDIADYVQGWAPTFVSRAPCRALCGNWRS